MNVRGRNHFERVEWSIPLKNKTIAAIRVTANVMDLKRIMRPRGKQFKYSPHAGRPTIDV
jgi:hypothetical protein